MRPMPGVWSLLRLRSPREPRTAVLPHPSIPGVPRPHPACKLSSQAAQPPDLGLTIAAKRLRCRRTGRPAGESVTGLQDPFAPTTSPSKWKEVEAAAPGDDVKKRAASLRPRPEAGSATWAPVQRAMRAPRSPREESRDRGPRSELPLRLLAGALSCRFPDGLLGKAGSPGCFRFHVWRAVAFKCFPCHPQ